MFESISGAVSPYSSYEQTSHATIYKINYAERHVIYKNGEKQAYANIDQQESSIQPTVEDHHDLVIGTSLSILVGFQYGQKGRYGIRYRIEK